jgi:hypothetical protein
MAQSEDPLLCMHGLMRANVHLLEDIEYLKPSVMFNAGVRLNYHGLEDAKMTFNLKLWSADSNIFDFTKFDIQKSSLHDLESELEHQGLHPFIIGLDLTISSYQKYKKRETFLGYHKMGGSLLIYDNSKIYNSPNTDILFSTLIEKVIAGHKPIFRDGSKQIIMDDQALYLQELFGMTVDKLVYGIDRQALKDSFAGISLTKYNSVPKLNLGVIKLSRYAADEAILNYGIPLLIENLERFGNMTQDGAITYVTNSLLTQILNSEFQISMEQATKRLNEIKDVCKPGEQDRNYSKKRGLGL